MLREYQVTRTDRRGNPTVTTQRLSEADAAALAEAGVVLEVLGDAPAPAPPAAPTKARRPANKAARPAAKRSRAS